MTEERTGRELTPRPEESAGTVTPREPALPQPSTSAGERFYAGDQAHTVGLTEERAAQIVRQSSNARMIAFIGALFLVLFIPLYWLYDIGLPVFGVEGRLEAEADVQYVTDVKRGYALYLANCARCHGEQGEGGVGPVLNDQGKLYNVLTEQGLPGTGHLNPEYLEAVLQEGGRYVCGDPNSVMPAWEEPKGPLNYREVDDIIKFITASKDITFEYVPHIAEGAAETAPPPVDVLGWRDPAYTPPPDATPVPECWRGPIQGGTTATPAPVENPGTVDNPRVLVIEGTDQISWVDPETDAQITAISVVQGETVEFQVTTNQVGHNFYIGTEDVLSTAPEAPDLPGIPTFSGATQSFTYTFTDVPDNLQFACVVPGHYSSMNGDFLVVPAGAGTEGTPAPGEGSPAPDGSPEPSPTASP
jgi:mono/diheme cytochrome c family protein